MGDLLALTNRGGQWYWMALGRDGMPVCGRTRSRDTAMLQAQLTTQPAEPLTLVGPGAAGWASGAATHSPLASVDPFPTATVV